jgi:hypothetical protein
MSLTEGDRAIVREIAFEVAKVANEESDKRLANAIKVHGLECPTAKRVRDTYMLTKGFIIGVIVIAAIVGGSTGVALANIIKWVQ